MSDWADEYVVLSSESSAEPGKWRTSRTPYLREIMDAVCDPAVYITVMMTSAQVGKTSALMNVMGYYIHTDPGPMMYLMPTIELAKSFSRIRFDGFIRDCEPLNDMFTEKQNDADNNTLSKKFPGGHLVLVGANSPVMLSSNPIRFVMGDEIDRFPKSAGKEGDPFTLAIKRTTTFHDRKIFAASTPTIKGDSPIEELFIRGDQRKYYVPCPHCGYFQTLDFPNLDWPESNPAMAHYVCQACAEPINHDKKTEMLANGEWRANNDFSETERIRSYHLNELYSPWVNWGAIASAWLRAKDGGEELKQTFTNLTLGESYESEDMRPEFNNLESRREDYLTEVPQRALVLTAGVDVQDDRFEISVWGWGKNYERWLIEHVVSYCNLEEPNSWEELLDYLTRDFEHESGKTLKIRATCIDSGGHYTKSVYSFCKHNAGYKIFPIKGYSTPGKPIISQPKKEGLRKNKVFMVGTDKAKQDIFESLHVEEPGPNYTHFPQHASVNYFKQLTAEKQITKIVSNRSVKVWIQLPGRRNEALDCAVYALAARQMLLLNWDKLETNLTSPTTSSSLASDVTENAQVNHPKVNKQNRLQKTNPRRKSYIRDWKR